MRDFKDHGARLPPVGLPKGALVCFTVDIAFEGFLEACQHRGRQTPKGVPDPYSLSFAEYGLRIGIWRLVELMEQCKLNAGIMVNGYAAERYPRTLASVAAAGHEMIAHGWTNDAGVASDDIDQERNTVKRTVDEIVAATGKVPKGWVSPGYAGSTALERALVEEGFLYTCDDAADDLPYVVDMQGRPLVVMPRTSFGTNDLGSWFGPKHAPATWLSSVKSQFEAIYDEATRGRPGWMELVLHAHFAGRLQAALEIRQMIEYVTSRPGVWCSTRLEFASWCLDQAETRR